MNRSLTTAGFVTMIAAIAGCALSPTGPSSIPTVNNATSDITAPLSQARQPLHEAPEDRPAVPWGTPNPCPNAPKNPQNLWIKYVGITPSQHPSPFTLFTGYDYSIDNVHWYPCKKVLQPYTPDPRWTPHEVTGGTHLPNGWSQATGSVNAMVMPSSGGSAVSVIDDGRKTPKILATILDPGQSAVAVAAHNDGTLYVSSTAIDQSYDYSGVGVYAPGKKTQARFLYARAFSSGPVVTGGVAVDQKHNVFLSEGAYGQGFVEEFLGGKNPGVATGIQTSGPGALLVDSKGNLVVSDSALPGIEVYPPGSSTPSLTIPTAEPPTSIAFDKSEQHLYVVEFLNSTLATYAYPSGAMIAAGTMQDGLGNQEMPFAIATEPLK